MERRKETRQGGPKRSRDSGTAALPIIITVAVAVTLLQVPLLYKTESGNKFSGSQKSSLSAITLAEAGIEEAIADIGRKAISLNPLTDTIPYLNVGLGRGSYTTRIKCCLTDPERLEVVSTGRIGGTSRTIRANMEIVKSARTIPYDTPGLSLWGIRGTPPTLYYHSLEERDSGRPWIHPEGEVLIPGGGEFRLGDFTVAPNGTMYFINNVSGSGSALYKIEPADLDNNPSTPISARWVGPCGLAPGDSNAIHGLTFMAGDISGRNGVLYAATWKSKKIYELDPETGSASFVSDIAGKGLSASAAFQCDAISHGPDGILYLVRNDAKAEIWSIESLEGSTGRSRDSASLVAMVADGSEAVEALAGHPNGHLYAATAGSWYRIDPGSASPSRSGARMFGELSDLRGLGFHFEREALKNGGEPIQKKIAVCHRPPGDCTQSHTLWIDSSALASHVGHGGGPGCVQDVPGACADDRSSAASDTTIRLKIVSWEESAGGVAAVR